MSYSANKPFGRRKTDNNISSRESSLWEKIRRDVDEDSSGLIRRYLRLSEKVFGAEEKELAAAPRRSRSRVEELKGSAA